MATLLSHSPRLFRRLVKPKALLPRTPTLLSPTMASSSPPLLPAGNPPPGFRPSGWNSAPLQWHRALCTYSSDPRSSSGIYDVGLAAVRGASFIPLHVEERGTAASPGVVKVSAGTMTELAEEGDSEHKLDRRTVKIMTYNVWFRKDVELPRRMYAIADLIQRHSPDLICLQEVTPEAYLLLENSDWWNEYQCSLSPKMAMKRSYYCMQMSKVPVHSFGRWPFSNTEMDRELCTAEVNIGGVTMVLATSHLESPCPGPPTWDQMKSDERVAQAKTSLSILTRGKLRNVVFCGDMNWDDGVDGPFPLPRGWVDAWAELRPGEDGWTYDTKANAMLKANNKLQKRLDRFVCRLEDFEMIGKEAVPGIEYVKVKTRRGVALELRLPVLPSDHFGLVLTVTRRQAGSASSE